MTQISGRGGCGHVACWLELHTSAGRSTVLGASHSAGENATFDLRPAEGYGILGLEKEQDGSSGLRLVEQQCGALPPSPPTPPSPPSPPSPPPHAAVNVLDWRGWELSNGGSGWESGFFSHDGPEVAFLASSVTTARCNPPTFRLHIRRPPPRPILSQWAEYMYPSGNSTRCAPRRRPST